MHTTTIPRNATVAVELTNSDIDIKKKNLQALDKSLSRSSLMLSSSVVHSASEQASWIKQPKRLLGISALPTLLSQKLIELAPTIHTEQTVLTKAQEFFLQLGKEIAVVQDRVGMVMPRILCTLINEALFAVGENIASPSDLDTAMKLGTNYPFGPIEWADKIGFQQVFAALNALHADLGEERYRIAPLLRQMTLGKKWWNI